MKVLDFDPRDPELFKNGFTHFDFQDQARVGFEEFGFSRQGVLALLLLRKLRAVTVQKHLSLFITVEGRHRSGKSRAMTMISCLFSRTFEKNMKKFIVSDADQLLDLVEEIERDKILCPVIIVDEAGTALNSADWFEKMQKAVVKTLVIVGWLLPTIIFIAPVKDLVLSGIRKMSHLHINIVRGSNKFAYMKFYDVRYDSLKGKPYFSKPRVKYLGMPVKIKNLRVSMPPKLIDDQYAEIEASRKPIMLKDIRDDAMKSRIKAEREVVDFDSIADLISKNPRLFETDRSRPDKVRLDANLIRAKFKITFRDAETVKRLAEILMDEVKQPKPEKKVEPDGVQKGQDDTGG